MSGSGFEEHSQGALGLGFLISEFRDLRKGMEQRDESLRVSIEGVRESVNALTNKVDRSQDHVDAVRGDVEDLKEQVKSVRTDFDEDRAARKEEQIRKNSSWLGPRRLIQTAIFLAGGVGAFVALAKYSPAFMMAVAPFL